MRRQQICVRQKMHKNYATHIEVLQNNNNHMRTQKNQKRHDEAKPSLTNFRFIPNNNRSAVKMCQHGK